MKCETCRGKGEVFQESGAGIHATANMGWVECPDCDGEKEDVDFCNDCGAEFTGFHYCEYARSLDED